MFTCQIARFKQKKQLPQYKRSKIWRAYIWTTKQHTYSDFIGKALALLLASLLHSRSLERSLLKHQFNLHQINAFTTNFIHYIQMQPPKKKKAPNARPKAASQRSIPKYTTFMHQVTTNYFLIIKYSLHS